MTMKSGYCFITVWLLVAPVLAQTERPKLEASIPSAKLEELVASRRRAQDELRASGVDDISPQILRWFVEPGASIAIVKMERVMPHGGDHYTVTFGRRKNIAGSAPAEVFRRSPLEGTVAPNSR